MLDQLVSEYHLHPIVDHFTIALLAAGVAVEFLASAATLLARGGRSWPSVCCQKLRSTASASPAAADKTPAYKGLQQRPFIVATQE
jgi:hypothetical protein